MRDLARSHGFTKDETQTLVREFPTRIEIVTKKPESGRPSEVVRLRV